MEGSAAAGRLSSGGSATIGDILVALDDRKVVLSNPDAFRIAKYPKQLAGHDFVRVGVSKELHLKGRSGNCRS